MADFKPEIFGRLQIQSEQALIRRLTKEITCTAKDGNLPQPAPDLMVKVRVLHSHSNVAHMEKHHRSCSNNIPNWHEVTKYFSPNREERKLEK